MTGTPHETDELRPFTVLVNQQPITTADGVKACIVQAGDRPTVWVDPVVRDGKTLMRVAGLARGAYDTWAQVSRGDEVAVIYLGRLYVD